MASDDSQLFPEAYRSTLATGTRQLLPAVRRWRWLLMLVAAILFALSFPLWWQAVDELSAALSPSKAPSASSGTTP